VKGSRTPLKLFKEGKQGGGGGGKRGERGKNQNSGNRGEMQFWNSKSDKTGLSKTRASGGKNDLEGEGAQEESRDRFKNPAGRKRTNGGGAAREA